MSNILRLQQNLLDIQERVSRELQFAEDNRREINTTIDLAVETITHIKVLVNRLLDDRAVSLNMVIGQPQIVETLEAPAEPPKIKKGKTEEQPPAEAAE